MNMPVAMPMQSFGDLTALSFARQRSRALVQRALDEMAGGLDTNKQVALLMVDLDRFRALQDICGPAGIDTLLDVVVHHRLGAIEGVRTFHLADGRFISVLSYEREGTLSAFIERLRRCIAAPVWVERHIVHLTASIGLVLPDQAPVSAEAMLHAAALALGEAQRAGGDSVRCYSPKMFAAVDARTTMEGELHHALLHGEIIPFYQPVYSLSSGRLRGFEALARWQHPRLGLIGPDRFLSLAEETQQEPELLFVMLRSLCRDVRTWPSDISVSINISPAQLCDLQLARRILRTVFAAGITPRRIVIEITEERLIDDVSGARDSIQLFRNAGLRVALDDFGSGYASLERLCNFEIDMLKIDRSLIRRLDSDAGRKLVRAVVELGRSLSMQVTAEGIETEEQARLAGEAGCTFGQGFLYGRAVPVADTYPMLQAPAR